MQFGNGTHLDSDNQKGIGKFGMGLPASSISQCTRVDVWTWQDGPENALHTYLDLEEIRKKRQSSVPKPVPDPVPGQWRAGGRVWGQSGTLVVWSDLDRCLWRTTRAIIDNTELVVGRMYRKWLNSGQVRIQLTAFNADTPLDVEGMDALPNDPGYLMAHTSCPAPFDHSPLFEPWGGEDAERRFTVEHAGQTHQVTVRYSVARDEARRRDNQGSAGPGRHARDNVGVSVVRAGRELEMDQGFLKPSEPTERWWGVEVDFPPALDDIFGVTNNKQSARNFADLSKMDFDKELKGKTYHQTLEEYHFNDDPHAHLLPIVNDINNTLGAIRKHLKAQTAGLRTQAPDPAPDEAAEATATARTRQRQEEGHVGQSDRDETLPDDQKRENIQQAVQAMGLPAAFAETLVTRIVGDQIKYQFVPADLGSAAFFQVKNRGTGSIILTLNTGHPVYDSLIEVLEESTAGVPVEDLRARLGNARDGLKTLLIAWARYEDELPEGARRQAAQNARDDWGRVARVFLTDDD